MKMIAVGDNVTDCYIHQKVYYPGGNAVNVAVNCKRNGFFDEVAYIGVFGNDENAAHIKWALDQEQVTYDRARTICARSGRPGVSLVDGDRVFLGGPQDTAQHIVRLRLIQEDMDYISRFDICHTSCYSNLEPELPKLQKLCQISFDFSEYRSPDYLKTVCPFIRFAFFSGAEMGEEEVFAHMNLCHSLGTEVVGVTQGKRGAMFSWNGKRYHQGIKPIENVIDTMGAGDSFIAGFLSEFIKSSDMEAALDYAATCAAQICTFPGGFGYPHPYDPEND